MHLAPPLGGTARMPTECTETANTAERADTHLSIRPFRRFRPFRAYLSGAAASRRGSLLALGVVMLLPRRLALALVPLLLSACLGRFPSAEPRPSPQPEL